MLSDRLPNLLNVFYKLSPDGRLRLIDRLKTFRNEETDRFWDELFNSEGLFRDLQSALQCSYLLYPVAGAAPIRVTTLIENGLRGMSVDQRKLIKGSERRGLVNALQELRLHRKISVAVLRCLILLAEAETEGWSNNSTGVFYDCFYPAHPQFPLSLNARFEILNKLFSIEDSVELRLIALKAINCAFSICHVVVPLSPSTGIEPFDPAPTTTQGEILDYFERLTDLLIRITQNENPILAQSALNLLPKASAQWAVEVTHLESPIAQLKALITRLKILVEWAKADKLVSVFDLDRALKRILNIFNEDISKRTDASKIEPKKAVPELRKCYEQIKQLTSELDHADFAVRLKKWAGSDWTDDTKEPQALAEEAIANLKLLTNNLVEWLCSDEAKQSNIFFQELGKLDSGYRLIDIIEQLGTRGKGIAFANYFAGLSQIDSKFVTKHLNELIDAGSVKADIIVAATGSIGYDSAGYQRIIKLIVEDKVNPLHALGAIYSRNWIKHLHVNECLELMKLIAGPDLERVDAIIRYLDFWSGERPIKGRLAAFAWRCLEAMPLIRIDDTYNLDEVAAILARDNIQRGFKLLEQIIRQSNNVEVLPAEEEKEPWDPLSIWGPHKFWNELWKVDPEHALRFILGIASNNHSLTYKVMSSLRNVIDQDQAADLLITLAFENEHQAKLICQ